MTDKEAYDINQMRTRVLKPTGRKCITARGCQRDDSREELLFDEKDERDLKF